MKQEALEKLSQAKAKLLVEKPYFGMLASRLELAQSDNIESSLSNGVVLQYNDEYIASLEVDEVQFVLANGAMHAVLAHENRQNSRMSWLWQQATDYAINDMLVQNGMELPLKSLYNERFEGMYAEEIYAELKHDIKNEDYSDDEESEDGYNEQDKRTQQEHHKQQSDENQDKFQMEVENVERSVDEEFFEELEKEAQAKASQMDEIPEGIERFVELIESQKIDWRELLRDALDTFFKNNYTMMPPSKKMLYKNVYLPSLTSERFNITIAIDSSGSIDEILLATFMSEVENIMLSLADYQIDLLVCDEKVRSHETFYAGDILNYKLQGGMGTSFDPVFEYIETNLYDTQLLLYFSDLDGKLSVNEPLYSVKWISQNAVEMPFGEVIVLEHE